MQYNLLLSNKVSVGASGSAGGTSKLGVVCPARQAMVWNLCCTQVLNTHTLLELAGKLKLQNRILIHLDFQDFSLKFYVTKREYMYGHIHFQDLQQRSYRQRLMPLWWAVVLVD